MICFLKRVVKNVPKSKMFVAVFERAVKTSRASSKLMTIEFLWDLDKLNLITN